jgi:hypothetical protein
VRCRLESADPDRLEVELVVAGSRAVDADELRVDRLVCAGRDDGDTVCDERGVVGLVTVRRARWRTSASTSLAP